MKFNIIFAFGAIIVISLIFIMEQRQDIDEFEGALENTLEQLENSDANYSNNDDFTNYKQPK